MIRLLFSALLLLGFPTGVFAQLAPGIPAGPSGPAAFSGGMRLPYPATPVPVAPRYPVGGGVGGGFLPVIPNNPGFPFSGIWGIYGYGGGYNYGPYGFGYAPSLSYSFGPPVYQSQPVEIGTAPNIALVNEFPATLTMEFPAPAEVWVNGKKGDGQPTTEWTLTSPSLKAGMEYTFQVKARWTVNGKTYEYERNVTVASGNRSRAQVIAGTEIKE